MGSELEREAARRKVVEKRVREKQYELKNRAAAIKSLQAKVTELEAEVRTGDLVITARGDAAAEKEF